jgi:serine phosphatase RsbU (regulator of sigma subunit)
MGQVTSPTLCRPTCVPTLVQCSLHSRCCLVAHARYPLTIPIQSQSNRGVSKLLLYELGVYPTAKGVPAALVMSTTCGMLQLAAQALDSYSLGEVLAQVNETLLARITQNMFVTCFYAILDPKSGTLRYANAGHDLPYLHRSNGNAEELKARGMPLGLMPGMGYEEKEIVLEAGEVSLLYSDGLLVAHDPQREMFGFPRLKALVAELGEERSLGDSLLEEHYTFVGEEWEQEDDITLLTLRRSAARG